MPSVPLPPAAALSLRRQEMERRLNALPAEIDEWKSRTVAELDMNAHFSQVNAIDDLMDALIAPQRALLDQCDPTGPSDVFVQKANDVVLGMIRSQKVWDFFRDKLDLRFTPRYKEPLWVADTVAWDCYNPVFTRAVQIGALADAQRREPPLTYLDAQFSPATWVRGSRPNDGRVAHLGTSLLPIPVIYLPWDMLENAWEMLVLHHEVGHDLEADLQLRDALEQAMLAALQNPSGAVPAERVSTWRLWRKELFADLVGQQLAGPAFGYSLLHIMLLPAPTVTTFDMGDDHPTPYPRMLLNCAYLRTLAAQPEMPDEAKARITGHAETLEAAWVELYGDHRADFPGYLEEFPRVAAALMDTPLAVLNGHTVRDLMPFTAEDEVLIENGWKYLYTGQDRPAALRPRHAASAARLAATIAVRQAESMTDRAAAQNAVALQLAAIHQRTLALIRESAPPGLRAGGGDEAAHQRFIASFAGPLLTSELADDVFGRELAAPRPADPAEPSTRALPSFALEADVSAPAESDAEPGVAAAGAASMAPDSGAPREYRDRILDYRIPPAALPNEDDVLVGVYKSEDALFAASGAAVGSQGGGASGTESEVAKGHVQAVRVPRFEAADGDDSATPTEVSAHSQTGRRGPQRATVEEASRWGEALLKEAVPPGARFDCQAAARALTTGRLRLKLCLPWTLQGRPWVLLCFPEIAESAVEGGAGAPGGFLALDDAVRIVRYVPRCYPAPPLTVSPPLRVLLVLPNPKTRYPVDLRREEQVVRPRAGGGRYQVRTLKGATLEMLRKKADGFLPHVVHFVGHAGIGRDEGRLILHDDEQGGPHWVAPPAFAAALPPSVRLLCLSTCVTQENYNIAGLLRFAQAPTDVDLPTAVVNTRPVDADAARAFWRRFWDALIEQGGNVVEAVHDARRAIAGRVAGSTYADWAAFALVQREQSGAPLAIAAAATGPAEEVADQARSGNEMQAQFASQSVHELALLLGARGAEPSETLKSALAGEVARFETFASAAVSVPAGEIIDA